MERLTYFDGGKWRLKIGDTEYSGEAVDRLAAIEDIFGDEYDLDRLRELAQADREGRVKIEQKSYSRCPKCGKLTLFPRIDWKYYYCYSCKTQFTKDEYEAALRREQDD